MPMPGMGGPRGGGGAPAGFGNPFGGAAPKLRPGGGASSPRQPGPSSSPRSPTGGAPRSPAPTGGFRSPNPLKRITMIDILKHEWIKPKLKLRKGRHHWEGGGPLMLHEEERFAVSFCIAIFDKLIELRRDGVTKSKIRRQVCCVCLPLRLCDAVASGVGGVAGGDSCTPLSSRLPFRHKPERKRLLCKFQQCRVNASPIFCSDA